MRGKPPRSRARSDAPRPSFMQTLQGLRQLHVLGLCHRDFSLENALLSSAPAPAWLGGGLTAKIIDLGACEALPALPGQLLPRAWPIRGEAREGVRLWCSRGYSVGHCHVRLLPQPLTQRERWPTTRPRCTARRTMTGARLTRGRWASASSSCLRATRRTSSRTRRSASASAGRGGLYRKQGTAQRPRRPALSQVLRRDSGRRHRRHD